MIGKFSIWLTATLGALVVSAAALQLWTGTNHPSDHEPPDLARLIPENLPGWTMKPLPLAETEEATNDVASILQFDRYVSRSYTRGAAIVTIYVAYWRADKVPPRMVGVHTPDTCWIINGWKCTQRERAIPLRLADGTPLKPVEFGTYAIAGNNQHVYFWHLVGGRPHSYVQEGSPSLTTMRAQLTDLRFGLRQKQEQYFVRVASNQPWLEVWQNPGIQALFRSLADLTLAAHEEKG